MATNIPLDPWQDHLSRLTSVPASKVLEASEVIRGLAGSWASTYVLDSGLREEVFNTDNRNPNPRQLKSSKIGQPGHPEINFVPYCYRTNRFGNKGGSFLGHPISFEVVGPTLKSAGDTYWSWAVTDNTGGADGDFLDISAGTLASLYGIDTLSRYQGGLFVIISQTAADGPFVGGGGIGDGALDAVTTAPLVAKTETSKFEIFRVVDIPIAGRLELDPGKRLSTHFTIPDTPSGTIRAITLIQPKATRLVAIPEPGIERGHEKTFAVVAPERALFSDEQYPYFTWTTNPSWTEYWLVDPGGLDLEMGQGLPFEYHYPQALPVPRPKGSATLYLGGGGAPVLLNAGWMRLVDVAGDYQIGDILHIYDIQHRGTTALRVNGSDRGADLNSFLGWFEVMAQAAGNTDVRRMVEVDPETGRTFFGSSSACSCDTAPTATNHFRMLATVHSPIRSLWSDLATSNHFDLDAVESARLTNLIDPRWTERSTKLARSLIGVSPARADRAIFNTRGSAPNFYEDPGSLLDLGFRMVLFPAVAGVEDDPLGGPPISITVPDFSRPITTNELLLDPAKRDEKQYVEIDYSNGLVRFSHAPQPGSDVWPTSTGTDNPRGELVLFASCVPYSMEEGQLGLGFRATSSSSNPTDCVPGITEGSPDHADVFSARKVVALYGGGGGQTIGSMRSGALGTITAMGWFSDQIPQSGIVEVLQGTTYQGDPFTNGTIGGVTRRGSVYGYDGVEETTAGGSNVTRLLNCYGGGNAAASFVVDPNNPAVVVWRKEFLLPQSSVDGTVGVDYQHDTTYGSAKRNKAIRFEFTDLKANNDGTVSVLTRDPVVASHTELFNDLYRSWLIDGGVVGTPVLDVGTYYAPVSAAVILKDGVRQVVPVTTAAFPLPGVSTDYYIKYTGSGRTECVQCTYETALPLDSQEDILLAVVHVALPGPVVTVVDLRNPLKDLDQRVDLYVGLHSRGSWPTYRPHFSLLSDAINFCNEIGSPSTGTGVRQFRIFVTGPVDQEEDYPIFVKTDGILIESAGRTDDTDLPEICWGSGTKASVRAPLIDLNGHSNFTLRGVSFRYLWDVAHGAAPTAADPSGTFVVRASDTLCQNVVIDNCRVMGISDGLVTATTAGYLVNWTITRNYCPEIVTSGIHVASPAYLQHALIADNVIRAHVATDAWAVADIDDGIVISDSGTHLSHSIVVERNEVVRFKVGIRVNAAGAIISGGVLFGSMENWGPSTLRTNRVLNTRNEGIVASGVFDHISGNYLYNVYRTVPVDTTTTWQRGLLFTSAVDFAIFTTVVESNTVIMAATWAPGTGVLGAAFYLAGGLTATRGRMSRIEARGNHGWAIGWPSPTLLSTAPSVLYGQDCLLEGTTSYWIVWGKGHRIVNNTMPALDLNYDPYRWFTTAPADPRTAGEHNVVEGNVFGLANGDPGRVHISESTIFKGNWVTVGVDPGALGMDTRGMGLYVADNCVLSGNYIWHLKDQSSYPSGFPLSLTRMTFTGNTIYYVGETGLGVVDGIFDGGLSNAWTGNHFLGSDVDIRTATSTVFVGNRFEPDSNAGGTLTLTGDKMVVGDNTCYSDKATTTFVVDGDYCTISGNMAPDGRSGPNPNPSILTVAGSYNAVSGNSLSQITVTGSYNEVTGNQALHSGSLVGLLAVQTGSFCTVVGNGADYLEVSTASSTVTGNRVGNTSLATGLLVSASDCTIQGNRVVGHIDADPGTAGNVTIMGNRVSLGTGSGSIRVFHDSNLGTTPDAIIMGNWVATDIQYWDTFTAASTVAPAGSHWVVQGNRAVNVWTVGTAVTTYPAVPANDNIN